MWWSPVGRTTARPQQLGGWRGGAAHGHTPRPTSANHLHFFHFSYFEKPFSSSKISFHVRKNGTGSLHLSREGPPPYFWRGSYFLDVFYYIFCCKILRAMDNHNLLIFLHFWWFLSLSRRVDLDMYHPLLRFIC
jgi:hypothetical protein